MNPFFINGHEYTSNADYSFLKVRDKNEKLQSLS